LRGRPRSDPTPGGSSGACDVAGESDLDASVICLLHCARLLDIAGITHTRCSGGLDLLTVSSRGNSPWVIFGVRSGDCICESWTATKDLESSDASGGGTSS
jgi:hypothetical protein